jgi:membrane associated rhomboid family serine protease
MFLRLPMVSIFFQLNREQAETYSLVLNSSGIVNCVIGSSDGFRIEVPKASVDMAREAIYRYQSENPIATESVPGTHSLPIRQNLSGVVIAFLLLTAHLAVLVSAAPEDYLAVFGANARRILDGDLYRCATALLLHADAAHIAGNMVGISLFGGAVCAVTGSGVGWLMILVCGILGNLINALAYETGHLSVGASTAVFGAVGILCALQAVNAARTGRGWKRTVLALGGGIGLLAFLGTSVRSDLGAHLFGFFSGLLSGGAYRLWRVHRLGRQAQMLCGTIAAFTLLISWMWGVGI